MRVFVVCTLIQFSGRTNEWRSNIFPRSRMNGRIIVLFCLKLLLVHLQQEINYLMALYVLGSCLRQFAVLVVFA